jgi:hypothetical protein
MLVAVILVIGAVAFSILILRWEALLEREGDPGWMKDAAWLGLVSVLAALVPVVISNREANFYYFSRYMLAGSAGAVIFVTAVIYQLNTRMAREAGISLLVVSAVITHHLNGIAAARTTEAMQEFWWQVSWRIPQLQPGTTLVANYSHAPIEEDYFVWGPANLIYYPHSASPESLRPVISSTVLTGDSQASILNKGASRRVVRRSIIMMVNFDNILILTQPFSGACVQVIDGDLPSVSAYEQEDVRSIAGSSNLDNILLTGNSKTPPETVFGPEPEHGWCYYYETASLAYQQRNWPAVVAIGRDARKQGFSAADPVEWMPFLQAAAIVGDQQEALELAKEVTRDPFLANQACTVLSGMPELSAEMEAFVTQTFCSTTE